MDLPETLDELIALTIKLDNRLYDRHLERCRRFPSPPRQRNSGVSTHPSSPPVPSGLPAIEAPEAEPMQLGRNRLTEAERERRRRSGECLYCGRRGHLVRDCQLRPNAPARR